MHKFFLVTPKESQSTYFSHMTIAFESQSDNLIFMKEMSATEVARNFSAVLDEVAAGEEIIIRRGKVEIARIVPAEPRKPNGAALTDAIRAVYDRFPNVSPYDPNVPNHWDEVMAMREAARQLAQDRLAEGDLPWRS